MNKSILNKLEKSDKITLLFLSWRDIKSPKMGGAEIFTHEMMKNSDLSKLNIIHISPLFKGAKNIEYIDGITYLRMGNIFSVILKSKKYYKINKDKINYVIDQCNTHRFFTKFWVEDKKRIFLIFQLTREIWDIQLSFPFNKIGKILENAMLKLNKNDITITISESTIRDLVKIGFKKEKIKIIPIGLNFKPWTDNMLFNKEENPTFIFVGRYAKYKGIDASISAFGEIKKKHKKAKLWIVGKKDNKYINKNLIPICNKYKLSYGSYNEQNDIIFYDFVTDDKKLELMSKAHVLLMPSIREGWGMIITEAAVVGTPSIVYNSPGIIDAVNFGDAGYIVKNNNFQELSEIMNDVIENNKKYNVLRRNAYNFNSKFNWINTGKEFTKFINEIKE